MTHKKGEVCMSDERVSPESSKQDFTGQPGGVAAAEGVSDACPLAAVVGAGGREVVPTLCRSRAGWGRPGAKRGPAPSEVGADPNPAVAPLPRRSDDSE